MNAVAALLVAASLAACGAAQQKPPAPVVIPPIARVHFEDDFGLIFVTASVAGSPRWLLLDSGADQTLLDRGVADELKLAVHDKSSSAQPGGAISIAHATDVEMFVGGVPFHPHDVWVTPLHPLERFVGRKIDGILGYELLERYVVTIDYAAQELAFYDPQHAPTAGDATDLRIVDREALVDVVLHDRSKAVAATLKVDTGSMDALGLTAQFVADNHLFDGVPKLARPGIGLGGSTQGELVRLSSIHIGSLTLGPLAVGYNDDGTKRAYAGTIGAELLQQFTVTFDYPHHLLRLGARERPPSLSVDGSGLVIATFADDLTRCSVLAVVAGSPAANAGIETGDEIVEINGTPFSELGLATLWSLLRQQGTVRLTVRHAGADRVVGVALRPLV